ncbi:MAG: DUF6160 family protein [Smithella sp.]|jgi:hypothetical protein
MKKTLILVLIAVFVMIPLASFAKTAISDSELGTVTGEAGISIDFSSIIGISNIFSTSWGVPTNGSSMNHHHPIITFFKHFFPTNTGGIYVPSNGGVIITITAH